MSVTDNHCLNGRHYDDMSCCHTLVLNEDFAETVALLRQMRGNDYPNGNEWAEYQDHIDALLNELPEVGVSD